MIIRKAQLETLDVARMPQFGDEMVLHLRDFTPLHSQSLGESGIRELIQAGMDRANAHGFTRRGAVRFYIETTVLFGIDFDTDPQYPWFPPLLDDPKLPDELERADKVHEIVTQFVSDVGGEGREYARRSLARARGIPFEPASRQSPDFNDRLIGRAQEMYPEKAAFVGRTALEGLIARAAEEAEKWDAATDAGVCLFFGLMYSVGHGVTRDPKYPWVAATLANPGYTPEKRVERLYSKAMIYLDRVLEHLKKD